MKKIFAGVLAVFLPLIIITPVFAQTTFSQKDNSILPQGETINGDYFATGDRVTISGTVNGDVYAAGGTVLVDGVINGDLMIAGGEVTIRGTVTQDVRTAGGDIIIASNISGNTTALGGNITVTDGASLSGSLVSGAGNLEIFGPIGRGMTIGAGNAVIGNSTTGDIMAGIGSLTVSSNASISGNLTYWSEENAIISDSSTISGQVSQNTPDRGTRESAEHAATGFLAGIFIVGKMMSFVTALILGLLFVRFLPKFATDTAHQISKNTASSLLVGIVALIMTPILCILLAITIIGIPLAILLGVIYIIDIFLVKIFVACTIGIWIANRMKSTWKSGFVFLAGLLLYYILTAIPVIGGIISFIALCVGLGASLISKKNYYSFLADKKSV